MIKKIVYKISLTWNPSSCLVKFGKNKLRALIDTGAEVSLISRKMYNSLSFPPKVNKNQKPYLQAANGESLSVVGRVNLSFKMNGLPLSHNFYVTEGLNRCVILGRDWLRMNGVRIYFDLGCLRIGKTYVKLQEDIHISSLVRINKKLVIKPQTAVVCHAKLSSGFQRKYGDIIEIQNIDECINDEPGLFIKDSVDRVRKTRKVSILVVIRSNKAYALTRGFVIGKAIFANKSEINNINLSNNNSSYLDDFKEIDMPEEYKSCVLDIVLANKDLFAKHDIELGHTETVKIKIETGNHPPI